MQRAPADLRLAILDSCASGAFTRRKGGVKRAPFLMDASIGHPRPRLLDVQRRRRGAQESDRIAASFFTYYLVSGLRGAADANQDRRVTLQEAFQFASQETLARTERTQAGPQHAAYEFDLAGTGDMVVTDVRGTQSGLVLTPELGGRISVREASGALVAELRKPAGNTIELGLDPGAYVVAMDSGSTVFQAQRDADRGQAHAARRRRVPRGGPPRGDRRARRRRAGARRASRPPTATAAATPPAVAEPTPFKAVFFPRSADGRRRRRLLVRLRRRSVASRPRLPALARLGADRRRFRGPAALAGANGARAASRARRSRPAPTLPGTGRGLQLAAGGNIFDGDFVGAQIAGGINTVSSEPEGPADGRRRSTGRARARGLQMAGGAQRRDRPSPGADGAVNYADHDGRRAIRRRQCRQHHRDGFRFGVVNLAGETRGFHFGVINVAKHEDGESFALHQPRRQRHPRRVAVRDRRARTNIGFKLGGRHLYTNLMAGYQPGDQLAAGTEHFSAGTQALRHRRRHRLALPRRARPARVRGARSGLDGDSPGLALDPERARPCRRCACRRACGWRPTSCCSPARASTSRSQRGAATWTSGRTSRSPSIIAVIRRCGSTPAYCSGCKSDSGRDQALAPVHRVATLKEAETAERGKREDNEAVRSEGIGEGVVGGIAGVLALASVGCGDMEGNDPGTLGADDGTQVSELWRAGAGHRAPQPPPPSTAGTAAPWERGSPSGLTTDRSSRRRRRPTARRSRSRPVRITLSRGRRAARLLVVPDDRRHVCVGRTQLPLPAHGRRRTVPVLGLQLIV